MPSYDVIVGVAYFVIIAWVGMSAMRRVKKMDDFAVAGGRIPWPILFASIAATFIGGGATLGLTGHASSYGFFVFFIVLGSAVQLVLVGFFIAPRLKKYAGAYTVADIMGYHFGRNTRILTGFLSIFFSAGMLGAQIHAIGVVFEALFGLPIVWGMVIGMALVIIYSMAGGMYAVIHTDVIQFIVLALFVPLALLRVAMSYGVGNMLAGVPPVYLTPLGGYPLIAVAAMFLSFLLGDALNPGYATRSFAAVSSTHSFKGMLVAGVYSMFFYFCIVIMGIFSVTVFPEASGDQMLPLLITNFLPAGISGMVLCAIAAAVMSTADSFLHISAVVILQDIYKPLAKKEISDRTQVLLTRATVGLVGVMALIFAIKAPTIVDALLNAFDIWAPTVVFPLTIAVLRGKSSPYAAFYAMIAGFGAMAVWNWVLSKPLDLPGLIVGVAVNIVIFFIVQCFSSGFNLRRGFKPEEHVVRVP